MLGKEILPEFTSCCCLSENARWPFFVPKTTFFSLRNQQALLFHTTKIWAKEYSTFSSYFNPKTVGDNGFSSEQISTETFCWVPLKHCRKCSLITLWVKALRTEPWKTQWLLYSVAIYFLNSTWRLTCKWSQDAFETSFLFANFYYKLFV